MFDYLFPIFGFGVVITGIVVKGLVMAAEEAHSQANSENGRDVAESNNRQFHSRSNSALSDPGPMGNQQPVSRHAHSPQHR